MAGSFRIPTNFNSPATPARKGAGGKGSFFSQAPSTTPKYDPPSYMTQKSTTPAGDPRRKIFGSSFDAAGNTFGHRNTPGRKGRTGGFTVPESSPPYDDEEDADGEVDEAYMRDGRQDAFMSSMGGPSPQRGLKRSRDGKARDSGMRDIARAAIQDAGPVKQITDPDDAVLATEDIMTSLDNAARGEMLDTDEAITSAAGQLSTLWSRYAKAATKPGGIGPDAEDPLSTSVYLSTLLIQLHNPHTTKRATAQPNSTRALALPSQSNASPVPIPRALLDWLNTYHTPLPDDFNDVHLYRPSPSAHESFWDVISSEILRGRVHRAVRLLKDAGFENAETAREDGSVRDGYTGKQLENVEEVVSRCIKVLESCPAMRDDNWDVKGADWAIFRQRVHQANADLQSFANASRPSDQGSQPDDSTKSGKSNIFAKSNPPLDRSMAVASMRAGSRVPWTIFQNLKGLYAALLGEEEELLVYCQDWVEGVIGLTVWWNGEDEADPNLRQSRTRVKPGHPRDVDVVPLTAYRKRLAEVFQYVTEQEEPVFQVDTLDPIQVGLACVMEDSVESAIGMLRTWDATTASSVVDIAALGGWLPTRPVGSNAISQEFSSEDLMVLSYGPGKNRSQDGASGEIVSRDEVLIDYAGLLAAKNVFQSSDGKIEKEGWELAVSVLARLYNGDQAQQKISVIFENMEFSDEARVDKVLALCADMGLDGQARDISERYADTLSTSGAPSYGSALIYYARAHAKQKLKATLSLLISLCLLHSASFPPKAALDARLASLLSTERTALLNLARVDAEAASELAGQVSGFATLRRFYELRDQDVIAGDQSDDVPGPRKLQPLESKREAAKALMIVIESASDCIRGGLFDPEIESVVPVDGLLALLGETLPLLGQDKRIFTKTQVFSLMRIVEDLDTAPGRIKQGSEGLLKASMNAYRNAGTLAGSSTMLKKSKSNLSASGSGMSGSDSWDMLASSSWEMMVQSLDSHESGKKNKTPIHVDRGWDWRKGLDAVIGADVGCRDVLALLRVALAREVARGWGGQIIWQ